MKQRTSDFYALSLYGSKMILDRPNHFGRVPIILGEFNLLWSDPNHFEQVQILNISPEKLIWTQPKLFGPDQSDLGTTKTIWTVQNHFGLIEGQGISFQFFTNRSSILMFFVLFFSCGLQDFKF
jgi:hypothetical protein